MPGHGLPRGLVDEPHADADPLEQVERHRDRLRGRRCRRRSPWQGGRLTRTGARPQTLYDATLGRPSRRNRPSLSVVALRMRRPALPGEAGDVDSGQRPAGPLDPDHALDRLARAGDIVEGRAMQRDVLREIVRVGRRRRGRAGGGAARVIAQTLPLPIPGPSNSRKTSRSRPAPSIRNRPSGPVLIVFLVQSAPSLIHQAESESRRGTGPRPISPEFGAGRRGRRRADPRSPATRTVTPATAGPACPGRDRGSGTSSGDQAQLHVAPVAAGRPDPGRAVAGSGRRRHPASSSRPGSAPLGCWRATSAGVELESAVGVGPGDRVDHPAGSQPADVDRRIADRLAVRGQDAAADRTLARTLVLRVAPPAGSAGLRATAAGASGPSGRPAHRTDGPGQQAGRRGDGQGRVIWISRIMSILRRTCR